MNTIKESVDVLHVSLLLAITTLTSYEKNRIFCDQYTLNTLNDFSNCFRVKMTKLIIVQLKCVYPS